MHSTRMWLLDSTAFMRWISAPLPDMRTAASA
jgi:hypothetical protein